MTMRSSTHAARSLRPPSTRWEPRSWVVVGHRSSGKTSLAEIVLHAARVIRQPGEVTAHTTLLDWSAESMAHEQSRVVSTAWMDIDDDTPIVWVDTPGLPALFHEQVRALHVGDGAVLVVDATKGIEQGTERVLPGIASDRPCVVVLTKADRGTDVAAVWQRCEELTERMGRRVVALHLPWTERGELIGIIDVMGRRALRYDPERTGAWSPEPIPAALEDVVWSTGESIAEAVALTDDDLLEQYLEDLELPLPIVEEGLRHAVAQGLVVPLAVTSASLRIGGSPLLELLGTFHPPPRAVSVRDRDGQQRRWNEDDGFVATVVASHWDKDGKPFHVVRVCGGTPSRRSTRNLRTGNAVKVGKWYRLRGPRRALVQRPGPGAWIACYDDLDLRPGDTLAEPSPTGVVVEVPDVDATAVAWWIPDDEAPCGFRDAFEAIAKVDPAVSCEPDGDGLRVGGACEAHLEIVMERVESRLGHSVPTYLPPVPYREVPAGPAPEITAVLKRTGEHGLIDAFAEVRISVAPTYPDTQFVFRDAATDEEALPKRFRPAIEQGLDRGCAKGPQGYPVVGVAAVLVHGEYDILCSTEAHFEQAGAQALARALEHAGTELVEPITHATLTVPNESTGDVLADLAAHRARVLGLSTEDAQTVLEVECPYRELRTLPHRMSSATGGRGQIRWELSHYRKVDKADVSKQREPCRPRR